MAAIDQNYLHAEIAFPGHDHASLYNVATMEPIIRRLLLAWGVDLRLEHRLADVAMDGDRIRAVAGKAGPHGEEFKLEAEVFIDTTGTAGGPANCNKYGHGCAMCILRCHSFGARVSLAAKAGVREVVGRKGEQVGAMSGSCKLLKESLDPAIKAELDQKGVAVVPIPPDKLVTGKLAIKACQQYALPAFEQNLVLLDTGHAKLMTPYYPLAALRAIPGLENARYEDPYAGGVGNSIRYMGMAPRDNALKVIGVANLFCAGEKAGLLVGHTEAIVTGTLAGHNAVRFVRGEKPMVLPDTLCIGDAIAFVRESMQTEAGLGLKYTFSGSVFFARMKQRGLYATEPKAVAERVARAGLAGVFAG